MYTGDLKERDVIVIHQIATVRHARGRKPRG
jgi:hypothetical protein